MTRQAGWYWTPERVVAAIQVFDEIYGRRPSWTDFNPGKKHVEQYKRFHDDNCWPTGATVLRHWGTWNKAMEAAGYEPIKPGTQENPDKYKTHCKNGHEFTPENTRRNKRTNARICRICDREKTNAYYARKHGGKGSRASRGMPPSDHPKWKEPA